MNEVSFKAMGRAINKSVTIVELIKVCIWFVRSFVQDYKKVFLLYLKMFLQSVMQRRIPGLHQTTSIGSTDITDTWEPKEEGLLP